MTAPAAFDLAARQPACGGVHDLDFGDGSVAYAFDFGKASWRRRNHFGERAEFDDEVFGQRFDVALRDGAEQHELQQFVIADRLGPGLPKTAAQPLAMAVVVGRARQPAGRGFSRLSVMKVHPGAYTRNNRNSEKHNLRDSFGSVAEEKVRL